MHPTIHSGQKIAGSQTFMGRDNNDPNFCTACTASYTWHRNGSVLVACHYEPS